MSASWCGASPCGLVELLTIRSLDSESNGTQRAGKSMWHFYGLPLEFTWHYFCHTLLVEVATKFCPGSKGGSIDAPTFWEECQGHILRKACGMGDPVTLSLENSVPQINLLLSLLIWYPHCPTFGLWELLQALDFFWVLLTCLTILWATSLFSGIRHSRLILSFMCSSPRISRFFQGALFPFNGKWYLVRFEGLRRWHSG